MCVLAIDASARFRAHELSSLCVAAGGDLLAVGDSSFRIARGTPRPLCGESRSPSLREFVKSLSNEPAKGSQWEGVATDGAGFVFVLQEHAGREQPSHVFVFSSAIDALVAVIALHVPKGGARWRRTWRADPNARAEGVVLLRHGHLLVVKQKDPIRLIEFGPPDDPPRGLGREELAGPGTGERVLAADAASLRYEPLDSWKLDPGKEPRLESVNDAAVSQGELYLISRSSRRIARVRLNDTALRVTKTWKLPREIESPEGLVVLEDLTPIVADDQPKTRRKRDNVFRLESLPAGDD